MPSRKPRFGLLPNPRGITKRFRLPWLTNSALICCMSPNAGVGGVAGSQPMNTAVHRSPNKLWRFNSIFNLCLILSKNAPNPLYPLTTPLLSTVQPETSSSIDGYCPLLQYSTPPPPTPGTRTSVLLPSPHAPPWITRAPPPI